MSVRNDKGQFGKGNPGGPGRPKMQTERTYLEVVIASCSPETWKEIVDKAVVDAKAGDSKAREWLSFYLVGRPGQTAPTLRQMAIDNAAGIEDGISQNEIDMASFKGIGL
jgi:hypothetical protein